MASLIDKLEETADGGAPTVVQEYEASALLALFRDAQDLAEDRPLSELQDLQKKVKDLIADLRYKDAS